MALSVLVKDYNFIHFQASSQKLHINDTQLKKCVISIKPLFYILQYMPEIYFAVHQTTKVQRTDKNYLTFEHRTYLDPNAAL